MDKHASGILHVTTLESQQLSFSHKCDKAEKEKKTILYFAYLYMASIIWNWKSIIERWTKEVYTTGACGMKLSPF